MKQYQDYLRNILENGERRSNRTGVDTIGITGAMMQFNLADGFPAVTTKRLAYKSAVGELIGFLRGYTSAAQFRELGCKIWDADANENPEWLANPFRRGEDDLGPIYGAQWRHWGDSGGGQGIDQLLNLIDGLIENPTGRRHIMTAWQPDELHLMAVPPCHVLSQFLVQPDGTLDLCMYQRSADSFLGVPFNIASYATLLHLVSRMTDYRPGKFTYFIADAHIYVNHIEQVREVLSRDPRQLPEFTASAHFENSLAEFKQGRWGQNFTRSGALNRFLNKIKPEDFGLWGYNPHPAIKGELSVGQAKKG